jgi:2-polyprenyl-6-methoxyphenol hydroxylase-like FAD-dependent oxidoreductase
MPMKPMHVAIVGYGTAGQAAAILLARDGHHVEVFEQTARPGPVGAGILLQPVGLQVLWHMELLDTAVHFGKRIDRLYGESKAGRTVMDMRYRQLHPHMAGFGMQRGALFSILADALPATVELHCAHHITDISEDGRRLGDAQGRRHGPFDLVLCADGAASKLRAFAGTPRLDRPYPWGALWCLVAQGTWPYPHELRQRYVGARRMIGLLPVGSRPGDPVPRLSFFWSLPTAGFEAWSAAGIGPWLEEIRALWPEALASLAGVDRCDQLSRASYRDAIPRHWQRGRMALLGDAAHAMSPQLGQGVNMALLDALALRDTLRSAAPIEAALASYQATRRAHVSAYQFWSRWLTPLFQSEGDLLAALRDLAFHPLGRTWGARTLMLRVLSGTQRGLFGQVKLSEAFLAALESASRMDRGARAVDFPVHTH